MTVESLVGLDANVPLSGTGIEAGQSSLRSTTDMLHLRGGDLEGNSGGPVLDASGQVVGIVTLASPRAPEPMRFRSAGSSWTLRRGRGGMIRARIGYRHQ